MGSFDIVGSVLRFCFVLFCFPYKINTQDQCVICLGTFGPGVCRWEGAARSLAGGLGILALCHQALRDFLPSSLGGRLRGTRKSVGLEFDLSPEGRLEEKA